MSRHFVPLGAFRITGIATENSTKHTDSPKQEYWVKEIFAGGPQLKHLEKFPRKCPLITIPAKALHLHHKIV
jgi:hypothetical protein